MPPIISTVIPTFNGERFIKETVDSALSQTLGGTEVIVVDDGSIDGTAEVLAHYGSRIKVVHKGNGGVATARNAGIKAASGQWIALLDHDDLWNADKLDRQLSFASRNKNCSMVYSRARAVELLPENAEGYGEIVGDPPTAGLTMHESLLLRNLIPALTAVIRRDVVMELGGFSRDFAPSDDYHLWLRLTRRYDVGFVSDILATVRLHTSNYHRLNLEELLLAGERAFAAEGILPNDPETARFILVNHYCAYAQFWAALGSNRAALQRLKLAWTSKPLSSDFARGSARVGKAMLRQRLPLVDRGVDALRQAVLKHGGASIRHNGC